MSTAAASSRLIGEAGRTELRSVTMGGLHSKLDKRPYEVQSWEALRPLLTRFDLDLTVVNAELAKAQIQMLRDHAERASPAMITDLLVAVAEAQSPLLTELARDLLRRTDVARLPRAALCKLARQEGVLTALDPNLSASIFVIDTEAFEAYCTRLASRLCRDLPLLPKLCTIQLSKEPARRDPL
jgi:hypothetical protein